MNSHLMLDLETLGKTPGSVIASIGAIAFNPFAGTVGDAFYVVVDRGSCEELGLVTDAETLAWWSSPERAAARAALDVNPIPLRKALAEFDVFWGRARVDRLWCQGPSFDEVILAAGYKAAGWAVPWRYNAPRCTRTVYDMTGIRPDTTQGTYHNALDDCAMQIDAIIKGFRQLGLCPPAAEAAA